MTNPRYFGLRGQAKRDTAFALAKRAERSACLARAKAPSPLRSAGAFQDISVVSRRSAFTLLEIMLVIAIMGIVMMIGYPAISDMVHRAPITQATRDVMEGCRKARALAILQGRPMELQIFPQDGRLSVAPAPVDVDVTAGDKPAHAAEADTGETPKPAGPGFSAQISGEVRVELLDVNFVEYKEADEADIKFYPNGTSDEFTMILSEKGEYRKITLEVVTGLASMDNKIK